MKTMPAKKSASSKPEPKKPAMPMHKMPGGHMMKGAKHPTPAMKKSMKKGY